MWTRRVLAHLLAMLTALAQAEVVKFEVLHTVTDDAGQPTPGVHARGSCPLPSHRSAPWLQRYSNEASRMEKGKS